MIMLVGAATVAAQSGGAAGSTSSGSSQKNPSSSSSGTGSSTYGSGQSGTSGSSGSTYGSGSTSSGTGSTSGSTYGSTGSSSSSSGAKLSWSDKRFVTKAAEEGHDEVALAELAAQRATNPEVRSFAQKLVDDHTKVNSELMTIASQKNVKIDKDDDKDRTYKRLSKKSGSEFDAEFVETMIDEHEKDIKMFEKASTNAKDTEVRSFASTNVTHLRDHLQQAQNLRQSIMATGREDSSTSSGHSTSGTTSSSSTSPHTSSSSSSTPSSSTYGTGSSSGTTGSSSDTTGSSTTKKSSSR